MQPTFGRQMFATVAARLLAANLRMCLQEPWCRVLSPAPQFSQRFLSPAIDLDGDWPRDVLLNEPLAPGFPACRTPLSGCITIRSGCRHASIFARSRKEIKRWLAPVMQSPPTQAGQSIVLIKFSLRAEAMERHKGNPSAMRLRLQPSQSPENLARLCERIGIAPAGATAVLDASSASFAAQYVPLFGTVLVAGPVEQLHLAQHAGRLAAFLTDEHWWACFLTNAAETHVFYDPRRGRG